MAMLQPLHISCKMYVKYYLVLSSPVFSLIVSCKNFTSLINLTRHFDVLFDGVYGYNHIQNSLWIVGFEARQ